MLAMVLPELDAHTQVAQARCDAARFESIPGPFLVLAPDLTVVAVSDEYLTLTRTSRDQVVGRSVFHLSHDPPAGFDQAHRARAERLQSVGMLAGGVAHEVNNMMTAVLGFAELVQRELGDDHPQHADVAEIVKAAMRAAQVTRQLLISSREPSTGPAVVDAAVMVEELVPSLRQLVGADRRLLVRCPATPVAVLADRGRLEQVVINLVANARDATATDGQIAIETDIVVLDEPALLAYDVQEVGPGRFVRLVVRDNGTGMPAEVLAHAFEPFFTTKDVGAGTGLGLAMVYGIVRQSNGFVRIESFPGEGTAVAIYLPLVDGEVHSSGTVPAAATNGQQGETVLVVEDDPAVRTLACRMLLEKGYRVVDAPNGAAALDSLAANGGKVGLVLTDVVMPRMTGPELAAHVRGRYPDLPILYMSGYSGDEVVQRGLAQDSAPLVRKPFTTEGLAEAVGELIQRRAGA